MEKSLIRKYIVLKLTIPLNCILLTWRNDTRRERMSPPRLDTKKPTDQKPSPQAEKVDMWKAHRDKTNKQLKSAEPKGLNLAEKFNAMANKYNAFTPRKIGIDGNNVAVYSNPVFVIDNKNARVVGKKFMENITKEANEKSTDKSQISSHEEKVLKELINPSKLNFGISKLKELNDQHYKDDIKGENLEVANNYGLEEYKKEQEQIAMIRKK
jgi:hypothetical protein